MSDDAEEVGRLAETYRARRPQTRRGSNELRPALSGRGSAKVFAAFAAGKTLRQIVIECEVAPETVRRLYRQFGAGRAEYEAQRARERAAAQDAREWRDHDRRIRRDQRDAERKKLAREQERRERDARWAQPGGLAHQPVHGASVDRSTSESSHPSSAGAAVAAGIAELIRGRNF
ncbi:MAG: hypothetical protein WKG00_35670 [Polyangiaceae bacterium]